MENNYSKLTSVDQRIADVERKIKDLQSRLQRLKDCKQVYDSLPFGEGDVCFHKEHGNVLIRKIEFGQETDNFEDIKYVIVTITGRAYPVSYKDVVAITPATKAIYGKAST